nr:MAG: capsid protein [Seabass toti-like virus]
MDTNTEIITQTEEATATEVAQVEAIASEPGMGVTLPSNKDGIKGFMERTAALLGKYVTMATEVGLSLEEAYGVRQNNDQSHLLREGNLDRRVASESGQTTHESWVNAPDGPAVLEPSWFITAPGTGGGAKYEPSSAVMALKPLYNGADPGVLSSAARLDVNNYSSQAVLGLMNSVGTDIENQRSSSCSVAARSVLYTMRDHVRGESPANWLGGRTTQIPLGQPTHPQGNYFRGSVNRAALANADVVASICNIEDFARESRGERRFRAGWGAEHWGASGDTGVAVVPILLGDAAEAAANTIWMKCFMEYPVRPRNISVIFMDMEQGNRFTTREWLNSSTVYIPGPSRKVLFVICDLNNNRLSGVTLETFGAGVVVVGEANRATAGGVDLLIGGTITGSEGANIDVQAEGGLAALCRWRRYMGTLEDYEGAITLVSESFVSFVPDPVRLNRVAVNGGWQDRRPGVPVFPTNGVVFANWDDLNDNQMRAEVARRVDSTTTPSCGYRFRNARPTDAPNLQFARYLPEAGVAITARLWLPAFPVTLSIATRPAQIADICFKRGKITAALTDTLIGQIGAPTVHTNLAPVSLDPAFAIAVLHKVTKTVTEVDDIVCRTHLINKSPSTWQRRQGVAAWRAIFPDVAQDMCLTRVPTMEWVELGFDATLPTDDLYDLKGERYNALEVQGGQWDQVVFKTPHIDSTTWSLFQKVKCGMGFTRALTPLNNIRQGRENGDEMRFIPVQFKQPSASRGSQLRYAQFGAVGVEASVTELPLGGWIATLNNAGHKIFPLFLGARPLVQGNKGELNPIFIDRTPGQNSSGDPLFDTQTADKAAILDF